MDIQELEKKIELLDAEVEKLLAAFEKKWWDKLRANKNAVADINFAENFQEYQAARTAAGGAQLVELESLMTQLRMNREPKLSELSKFGDQMSLEDFIDCCKCGALINYDGFGHYVKDNQETDIEVYPSDVKNGYIRKDMDSIIWFNR